MRRRRCPRPGRSRASAFNWTPEVIRAERPAPDIAVGIVADGVASMIEIEPGQLWRSFPESADAEVDALRPASRRSAGRSASSARASMTGLPRGAAAPTMSDSRSCSPSSAPRIGVGATGVRLPIGQAGEPLLRQLLPTLHELDLVLFEEIQGQQTPDSPGGARAIDDDRRHRRSAACGCSSTSACSCRRCRRATSSELRAGGVHGALLAAARVRLARPRDRSTRWSTLLRSGGVPPAVHTMLHEPAGALRTIGCRGPPRHPPARRRVPSQVLGPRRHRRPGVAPIRDLGAELAGTGFTGTLTSEWGGHEWLDDDPATMTRAHLTLARAALQAGAARTAVPTL